MRICSIVTSLTSGGAEVLVSGLSSEFAEKGDHSLVIALCDAETLGNSPDTEARMAEEIEAGGGRFVSLGLPASRGPISGMLAMRKVLRRFKPDMVHAHTVRALPMIALARAGAPVAFTHHNTRLPFSKRMFPVLDRMTDLYIAIGEEVEGILSRHVRKPVIRIFNGAGRSFSSGRVREAPQCPARILSVGAISAQKNYGLVIDTANALRSQYGPEQMPMFTIAGGGPDLESLRASVAKAGLAQHVRFVGERSDVPELMDRSDLYLNVSRYEGMPLTLLEAMASGLPIVATNVPGNRELVIDGQNGHTAPLDEPSVIARTIVEILEDRDVFRRLSQGSLARSHEYSIGNTALKHREAYAHLIEQSAGLPRRGSLNCEVNAPQ